MPLDEPGQQHASAVPRDPIAIIGIGCRFPGARGPEAFWRLMWEGRDAITEVPRDRFDIDAVYDPRPGVPGRLSTRWGGFIEGVDRFDPYFFGISPREAAAMDPQQRLLLEVAWEAIEDAGLPPERLAGSRAAVFVGLCNSDYAQLLEDPAQIDIYVSGGISLSVLSGRLSYVLGLQGPSVSLDTACSTSLVAVHLACQSLWAGESTLALAGGVNLILLPEPGMGFSRAGMLAPDGRCKFGDARADGFIRSDGAGVVVLKPLAAALADRDPIYALIRGSAVNNDGRSGGLLMTPSRAGQEEAFRTAYRNAGLAPADVQYVECHGTGTGVGDPTELQALGAVLAEGRPADRPCLIGSVKTNIGHAEGAAGIAGLIKVALALRHRAIPASLHLQEPNPNIPWADLPLRVQREPIPWPAGARPARAGVSSFGISGTNAHVVLEEAPEAAGAPTAAPPARPPHLLPISAHTPDALRAAAAAYLDFLRDGQAPLADVAYTAAVRRGHHDFRLALVADTPREAVEHLEAFLQDEARPGLSSGRRLADRPRKLVFVFPGQGAQWVGMAHDLIADEPVFRQALERCEAALRPHVGWSVVKELAAEGWQSRLEELDVVQPTLFAVQVALAALWRAWGVEPDAVVGHSMGEVAAAHVAGILSLDDAARIICRRSRIVRERAAGKGAMAVVELPAAAVEAELPRWGGRIVVAAHNGPTTTVVAGDPAALEELREVLERRQAFFHPVKVDYASHSPHMDPLQPALLEALEGIRPGRGAVPMVSTVTGAAVEGPECDARYWVRNLRDPVLFRHAAERLAGDGYDLVLEISPHPALATAITQTFRHRRQDGIVLPSLRRGEPGRAAMLGSLGALYTAGYPVDWRRIYPSGRCVPLPLYPWQRERFWLERPAPGAAARRGEHPLLGVHVRSAAHAGTHIWESRIGPGAVPYLGDHRVQGLALLPAAAYVEAALAAARAVWGEGAHVVERLSLRRALFFRDDGPATFQVVCSTPAPGEAALQFFGQDAAGDQAAAPWTLLATATLRRAADGATVEPREPLDALRARCEESVAGPELYEALRARGLQYGPAFQGVERAWRGEGEALARLRLPESLLAEASAYRIHPALLDAGFQVLAAALAGEGAAAGGGVFLPVALGRVRRLAPPAPTLWSHATLRPGTDPARGVLEGDVRLLNDDGQVVLEALGFVVQQVEQEAAATRRQDPGQWLYAVEWPRQARPAAAPAPAQPATWVVLARPDDTVRAALEARLEAGGGRCVVVEPGPEYAQVAPDRYRLDPARPEHLRRLLAEVPAGDRPPCRGVVHLAGPDDPDDAEAGAIGLLHLAQALAAAGRGAPRLWLVTRGLQPVGDGAGPVSVAQAPVWGLGRVVAMEHPELRCTMVDLSPAPTPQEIEALLEELRAEDREDQVALRGGERHVARLARWTPPAPSLAPQLVAPRAQAFRLEVPTLGILDDFRLRAVERRAPGPGEVEIEVRAVGLNFRDVLIAMGLVPPVLEGSRDFGFECAGTIVAVGDGVRDLKVGDAVLAGALGCFGSYVTTPAALVAPRPPRLSFEQAATIPIAFLTAYYALHHLARLAPGERVLIHAAAGGVGLAAVQLAQKAGAVIFATAGSEEKREFLRGLGVEHVMSSRSVAFADEVLAATGGEGVDVVLNSLAGEFIPKGLSTLRAGGRFLEIGKVDVLQNTPVALGHLDNNIAFFAIDLSQLIRGRPDLCRSLLHQALRHFEDAGLEPLPARIFPISQVAEAFRHMAQARHIGKVVVTLDEAEVPVVPAPREQPRLRADATYLITGGLGALGLAVAGWMVERGARHLILAGRSAPSPAAQAALGAMAAAGARVVTCQADVSREDEVARLLGEIEAQGLPPLGGVIHAAAVLDDGILLQQTAERFRAVMAPKIRGAWHLHALTRHLPLDFFVLFSSGASVLGSPGQGNYVAANAFLDALAHHRRALGLPAVAINWGAWGEIGQAARADRAQHLTKQGILPFSPAQGLQLLGRIMLAEPTQVAAMAMEWPRLLASYSPPFLSRLAEEVRAPGGGPGPQADGRAREAILAADPGERQALIEDFLVRQVARVLRCPPARVDRHQPLNRLGIDSLMAVELKNRVEAELGATVPVTALLQGPTLSRMAAELLAQLGGAEDPGATLPRAGREGLAEQVEQLSDTEVDALLQRMVQAERDARG